MPTTAQGWDDGTDGVRHHRRHQLLSDVQEGEARPYSHGGCQGRCRARRLCRRPAVLAVYLKGPCYQVPF
jgi:hypothetical protein